MLLILKKKGSKEAIAFQIGHYSVFKDGNGNIRFGWERTEHALLGISFSKEYLESRMEGAVIIEEIRGEPILKPIFKLLELYEKRNLKL